MLVIQTKLIQYYAYREKMNNFLKRVCCFVETSAFKYSNGELQLIIVKKLSMLCSR